MRALRVLDLFTETQPIWTSDLLIESLGMARATTYRYLRALVDIGFLTPDGGGAYSLGPRFIEGDRQIRIADPLLQVAPEVIHDLRAHFAGDQLLCRYYGLQVLSIYVDKTDPRIKSSFDRGRPFSLFMGAPSRIILANLPQQRLQRLFLMHAPEIAAAGLGSDWLQFRDHLREVRRRGYAIASEVDKSLVGISAPIFLPTGEVTASLCLVKLKTEVREADIEELGELAGAAAAEISARLAKPLRARTGAPAAGRRTARDAAASANGKAARRPQAA